MIHKSDSDTTVRRFDLSQQFTAMQRISVVLSRATEASKTLQEVLSVFNDAFMQHGMICLYDSQQEILSIEALQQTENRRCPAVRKFATGRAKDGSDRAGAGPVAGAAARRRRPALSRSSEPVRLRPAVYRRSADGPQPGPSAYWRRSRWRVRKSGCPPARAFSKPSPIWSPRRFA
jgi:hypothetical protein